MSFGWWKYELFCKNQSLWKFLMSTYVKADSMWKTFCRRGLEYAHCIPLQRAKTLPPPKNVSMRLNNPWLWGLCSGHLEIIKYLYISVTLRIWHSRAHLGLATRGRFIANFLVFGGFSPGSSCLAEMGWLLGAWVVSEVGMLRG